LQGLKAPLTRLEQIYFHAARFFVDRGFAATSMSDIAEAVGITKAGLYHFVESKEDLLFNLMTWGMDVLDEDVTVPASKVREPLERLHLIVRNHLRNIGKINTEIGNPLTIILDEPAGLSPERRQEIQRRKRAYFDVVRNAMKDLQRDGRLVEMDPSVATFSVIGAIVWFGRWHRPGGSTPLPAIIDQITGMVLRGVVRHDALVAAGYT
jgi:AcrR family transcriptional regulator